MEVERHAAQVARVCERLMTCGIAAARRFCSSFCDLLIEQRSDVVPAAAGTGTASGWHAGGDAISRRALEPLGAPWRVSGGLRGLPRVAYNGHVNGRPEIRIVVAGWGRQIT